MRLTTLHHCFLLVSLGAFCVVLMTLVDGRGQSLLLAWWTKLSSGGSQSQTEVGQDADSRKFCHQNCTTPTLPTVEEMEKVLEDKLKQTQPELRQNFTLPCSVTPDGECISTCPHPLSARPSERIHDLLKSPRLTLMEDQRHSIFSMASSVPEADVIFLSAASSNHYDEMQAMYQNLHKVVFPYINNSRAVLVDLGLTEQQRNMTEKHCQCQVITFPAGKFPRHCRKLHCYSWKPLIVRAVMERVRKLLVYTDASIRWMDNTFTQVLNKANTRGLQLFQANVGARIPVHTLKQTFDYFGWEPCAFDNFLEVEGSVAVYKKEPFVIKTLLEPWAKCALERACMCPVNPAQVISCKKRMAGDHRCHRFDQSVLGILTARIFNTDISKFIYHLSKKNGGVDDVLQIRRRHQIPTYFSDSQ